MYIYICIKIYIYVYIRTYIYIYTYVYIYIYIRTYIYVPLFVTLKKVYDRNVVNKYLLLGVIIYYLIDYMYIHVCEYMCNMCRLRCIKDYNKNVLHYI